MKASTFPSLEGLDDLARRSGVDTRPILVRVLTDLYVQKPAHTPEEETHYVELVSRLLDAVDVPTRVIVATKLAGYAAAPALVVRRLARDVIEVAEPILRQSSALNATDLVAIIEQCGPRYASAIAARQRHEPARTTDSGGRAALPRHLVAPPLSHRGAPERHPAGTGTTLGELFLAASRAERRAILSNIDDGGDLPAPPQSPSQDLIARLEAAARERRPDDFVREIETKLGFGATLARRIAEDDGGEPLLILAKAIGMSCEVLIRILLFVNAAIGESVPRVFDLAKLYQQLTDAAALQIFASWRAGERTGSRLPVHQPVLWNDEGDTSRRAATAAARRGITAPAREIAANRPDGALAGRRHGTT